MGSLRTVISEVKALFQGNFLHSDGDILSIDASHIRCDLLDFRKIVTHEMTLSDMREAAGLWKGGFLKGFHVAASSGFYDWQLQEGQHVFNTYKQLLMSLYTQEITQGDFDCALGHAQSCLALDNFDEESHRAVIYIHALRGERKLALEQYEICRTIMSEEFQTQVEDETEALVQRIKAGDIRKNHMAMTDEPHVPRLAILPFHRIDICDHETALFLNMTMEALEDFFAMMHGLRIISRTSMLAYNDSAKRLPVIAAELQADFVIEGFCKGDGTSLLIEGRLVRAKTDDVVAIRNITVSSLRDNPTDAARHLGDAFVKHLGIAKALEHQASEEDSSLQEGVKVSSLNSKLKLQAKHLLRLDEEAACLKAVELYREAVRIDPLDAEAWAGIGSALLSYNDKGICFPNRSDRMSEMKLVANRALEINQDEPTALTILGNIAVQEDWDFIQAEELYKKALGLLPNSTRTLRDYAELCIMTGRHSQALELSELMNVLDPVNHHNFKIRFWLYLVRREFQKAEEMVRQQFLLFPAPPLDQILQAHIQLIKGDTDIAISSFEKIRMHPEQPPSWDYLMLVGNGYACAVSGRTGEAMAAIERLKAKKAGSFHSYIPIAQIYTGLKDYDSALDCVGTAVEAHDSGLFFLTVNPLFAPLNDDPRLEMILRNTHIIPVKKIM
ncbi:MAG: BTAD domain-containing putative transcriptional regulator [Sphaerochaetaceae bacterium]|jgi:DNA-binding SARP family transcriptional activator/Flp pilus assembly protein TadD|nr:BTAD domain-containing putative transcriptional regulator [Sphaerochaetaceae bacterium]